MYKLRVSPKAVRLLSIGDMEDVTLERKTHKMWYYRVDSAAALRRIQRAIRMMLDHGNSYVVILECVDLHRTSTAGEKNAARRSLEATYRMIDAVLSVGPVDNES